MAMFNSEFMRHVGDEYAARDRARSHCKENPRGKKLELTNGLYCLKHGEKPAHYLIPLVDWRALPCKKA